MRTTYFRQLLVRAAVAGNAAIVALGLSWAAPPLPKQAATSVDGLPPVSPDYPEGTAFLPDAKRIDFALDLDGKILGGDWNIVGRVTEVGKSSFQFSAEDGKVGHFVYHLPGDRSLSVRKDARVDIKRTQKPIDGVHTFDLLLKADEKILLVARRLFNPSSAVDNKEFISVLSERDLTEGDFPVLKEVRLQRSDAVPQQANNAHVKVLNVPVSVAKSPNLTGFNEKKFEDGRTATVFHLGKATYGFSLIESRLVVPRPGSEGIVESPGYSLEYVLARNEQ